MHAGRVAPLALTVTTRYVRPGKFGDRGGIGPPSSVVHVSVSQGEASCRLPKKRQAGVCHLYDGEALSPEQKELFDRMMAPVVPWVEGQGFQVRTEAGRLIGPFNPALLTPGISLAFLEFQPAVRKHTSLSERCREVVILNVGAVWQAPYELYAHLVVGRHVGLSDEAVHSGRRRAA